MDESIPCICAECELPVKMDDGAWIGDDSWIHFDCIAKTPIVEERKTAKR